MMGGLWMRHPDGAAPPAAPGGEQIPPHGITINEKGAKKRSTEGNVGQQKRELICYVSPANENQHYPD